jgi:hypothetical protein
MYGSRNASPLKQHEKQHYTNCIQPIFAYAAFFNYIAEYNSKIIWKPLNPSISDKG